MICTNESQHVFLPWIVKLDSTTISMTSNLLTKVCSAFYRRRAPRQPIRMTLNWQSTKKSKSSTISTIMQILKLSHKLPTKVLHLTRSKRMTYQNTPQSLKTKLMESRTKKIQSPVSNSMHLRVIKAVNRAHMMIASSLLTFGAWQ